MLACFLWALALAASPQLHEWLHGDACHHDDHECAATLIATGGCDAPNVVPVVVVAPLIMAAALLPQTDFEVPNLFLIGRSLEHGPPVAKA